MNLVDCIFDQLCIVFQQLQLVVIATFEVNDGIELESPICSFKYMDILVVCC